MLQQNRGTYFVLGGENRSGIVAVASESTTGNANDEYVVLRILIMITRNSAFCILPC